MSDYIVSARKYRPDSFETLVGQDNIARTLKNSILRGQLAHAYLFCGPRGVGKTSTARIFAKTINCSNPTAEMEPCGECESCKSFAEGRSYCIHELDAASNNGVEDIKTLMDQVQIPPQVGRYSVYIIDEVHMLSQAAFNAFLKTLEEPPVHAIFILATTEKHKILPTILSRCQTYDFNRISIMDIVGSLRTIAQKEGITIDDESLHIIAQKADGAMRDALTIFDQTVAFCGTSVNYSDVVKNLNVLDYEYSFKLVDSFLAGDYASALLEFDEILAKGFNSLHFVSALSSHLRDLLVSRTAGLDSLLDLPESLKERYREQAQRCSLKFLYDALEITTQCETGFKASANQRLHIEFALMKLAFLCKAPAADVQPQPQLQQAEPVKPVPVPEKPVEEPVGTEKVSAKPVEEPVRPAAESAAAAPETKKAVKGAAGLSLASLMDEAEESEPVEETVEETAIPEDSILEGCWKTLAESYSNQPRLANALLKAPLAISEADGAKTLTFSVMNEGQQKWIKEKILRQMEGAFQKACGSSKVRLDVDIIPVVEEVNRIYLPEEKAKVLMEENPEVKNLVIDLDLDI